MRLTAFGPFTGRELVFAGDGIPAGALHVVYGTNEAGKSTALRAVAGLLFGIPSQTIDGYEHAMSDLRVGGVLEGGDGTVVEVIRRKGKKNTLLDREGKILDDGLLGRLCGAASEATFSALFGLDHVSLRQGAEALLAGQGDVGESLFEAALGGGRGIHRVLQELEAEADALFTPKAHKRKLNDALAAYQESRKTIQMKARSGEGWLNQKRALEEAKTEHERLGQLLRARKRELDRLERARRLLPLGARRARMLQRIAELGEVTLLPDGATKSRETALNDRAQAAAELARLSTEIGEATARRKGLSVPAWLDEPAAARLADLPDRLGAHRKAAEDRPRLLGTVAAHEEQAEALAAQLRVDGSVRGTSTAARPSGEPAAAVSGLLSRFGVAERARVRGLSLQEGALTQREGQARRSADELEGRQRALSEELVGIPAVADGGVLLRRLLRRIERDGDLEARLAVATEERERLAVELGRLLAPLGLGGGAAAETVVPARILAVAVPSVESVDRFAAEMQALAVREDRLEDETGAWQRRVRGLQRKLADLERGGELPSVDALAVARARREMAWAELLRARELPGEGGEWKARAAAYEDAVLATDQAADRLLRQADRVASAAALESDRADVDRSIADAAVQRTDLEHRRAATRVWWNALWAGLGVTAQGPEEMRAWLRRFGEATGVARQVEGMTKETSRLDAQVRRAREELRQALASDDAGAAALDDAAGAQAGGGGNVPRTQGADATPRPGDLAALCEQAAEAVRLREDALARGSALARELADVGAALARARRDFDEARLAVAQWRLNWAEAIEPLGLAPTSTAAEAEAVLEIAAALALKQEQVAETRRRLQGIDRDTAQLEQVVRGLVESLGPDLARLPMEQAAESLLQRYREGQQARLTRAAVDEDLRRRVEARHAAELAQAAAQQRLDALARAARVSDLGSLELAERRSAEALELRRQLQDTEDHILAGADGLALEAALREIAGATAEDLDDRIDRLREEIDSLDHETQTANRSIGSVGAGLRLLEDPGGVDAAEAADASDEAQGHLARIRALAEEYARLRLAARLLSRAIERYREQHQGPVLIRAGVLLARLTLNRYTALRADFDERDRPVIRCVRADGTRVSVDGLSDGTRDQLYLALRLATLERQAAASEPLPLILDDILIHFDDERAAAALTVLAEHARSTQVVLFTHHARIVDLAERLLPAQGLKVSRLEG